MERRNRRDGFYTRGFTTFLLLMAAVVIFTSGAVLYVTPKGRVAHWTGWTMLGLEKEQWGSIHITAGLLFVAIAALHVFYNWKVLLNYIRSRRTQGFRQRKEFAAALAIAALFVAGTLWEVPPFSSVIALHEEIKDYWEANSLQAPVAHAEELTLDELARRIHMSLDEVVDALEKEDIEVADRSATVGEVAEGNSTTPDALYRLVRPGRGGSCDDEVGEAHAEGRGGGGGGGGMGRLTLADHCASEGLKADSFIAEMKAQGIQVTETTTLRELANALKVHPRDVAGMVRGVCR